MKGIAFSVGPTKSKQGFQKQVDDRAIQMNGKAEREAEC